VPFELSFTQEAAEQYEELRTSPNLAIRLKAVTQSLRLLAQDPRHPSLQTHAYASLSGPEGAKVFEAYAEQNTPAAYRIFWCYYPAKTNTITVLAITPHP
jgi:hypothetical protein